MPMRTEPLTVLHEDNHLLVVCKPAGLLTQGDASGHVTLMDLAKAYLKERYAKPGNVYLGLVHRLDRNVSGVVALARTSKAAARLSAQFRERSVRKSYLAVVEGGPAESTGELVHHMGDRADGDGRTPLAAAPFPGSKEARLRWRRIATADADRAVLLVQPITGRRHQIRAQLAAAGWPIAGDRKYGASVLLPDRALALHAWRLELKHPVGGTALTFTAPPPCRDPWPSLPQLEMLDT